MLATQFTTDTKSAVNTVLEKNNKISEISDFNLQSSDTENMIQHGQLYTNLLSIYVSDINATLEKKRRLKEDFYRVCIGILGTSCLVFLLILISGMAGSISTDNTVAVIGVFVSFLTIFIVIPHTIAKYLFNTDEEKYMTDIIKSMQEHDVKIREGIK